MSISKNEEVFIKKERKSELFKLGRGCFMNKKKKKNEKGKK